MYCYIENFSAFILYAGSILFIPHNVADVVKHLHLIKVAKGVAAESWVGRRVK